jgi:membrane-bound lytic murein transglycosylase D
LFSYFISGCQTLSPQTETRSTEITPAAIAGVPVTEPVEMAVQREVLEELASIEATSLTHTIPNASPAQPPREITDSWERMRRGFSLGASRHPKVLRELNRYRNHPEHLGRIQERAKPYIHFILNELEARQMPMEIALLPAVESAFQPFAYSPGHAAGIWQFIPSTGRSYGLKQNWWYDGRRDIVASTQAALDYLKRLNQRFDGDWELALAAYNAGAGKVLRAIRKNRAAAKPTDYWSLDLPRETRNYVPRLLALSQIFAEPEAYGIRLQVIPDEPYFETVDIESQLDLTLAAEMSELSLQELFQLNPAFNRWATDPDGPHRLHLPLDKVEGFVEQLDQLPDEKRVRWKRYKIRRGDSLSVIAQRHRTSVQALKQVNQLRSSKIRAGRHLMIPVSAKHPDAASASAQQPKPATRKQADKGTSRYVVKHGDSLWSIAIEHGVRHQALADWNAIAPHETLHPGQELVIRTRKMEDATLSKLDLPVTDAQSLVSYEVRPGDSLYRIAERFRVTVNELREWNSLSDKYLQPGQRIKLYVDVTDQQTL